MLRPDPFAGIAGHASARAVLAHQVESGRMPHAYLFTGEGMLGKTTAAQALAQALLPEAALHRHPDYWEDDRAEALRIDEIRLLPDKQPEHHAQSLQAFLAMKPAIARYRVAVISNVGRLPDPVQGILLKTLEEPHPGRVIVLTTPGLSPFVVLPTVVSRCQRVAFHAVPEVEVADLLRRLGTDPARAAVPAGEFGDRDRGGSAGGGAGQLAAASPPPHDRRQLTAPPGGMGTTDRGIVRYAGLPGAERESPPRPGVLPARGVAGRVSGVPDAACGGER
jgi:hypothetical protein